MSACLVCQKQLGSRNRSGYCKQHSTIVMNTLHREKRAEGFRKYVAANKPRLASVLAENARKAREADPGLVERIRENARRMQRLSKLPEHMAKRDREAIARRIRATKLAWCPAVYREEYRRLIVSKRLHHAEAKQIILDQVANDTRGLDPLAAAIKLAGLAA